MLWPFRKLLLNASLDIFADRPIDRIHSSSEPGNKEQKKLCMVAFGEDRDHITCYATSHTVRMRTNHRPAHTRAEDCLKSNSFIFPYRPLIY